MPILVNNTQIKDEDIHSEMQYHPAISVEAARHKAEQALVIKELLLQAAKEKKLLREVDISDSDRVEKSIEQLIEQEVHVPELSDENCKRYYQLNLRRFKDKKTNQQIPFDKVKKHIQDYLYARSLQTGIRQYIKILAKRAKIAGFEFEENDSPLVQ